MVWLPCFPCTSLFLLLGLLLQHLLDDLLLLDKEGTDNAVLDAVGAPRAAIGPVDGLLGLRDLRVLAGSEGRDLWRGELADKFPRFDRSGGGRVG